MTGSDSTAATNATATATVGSPDTASGTGDMTATNGATAADGTSTATDSGSASGTASASATEGDTASAGDGSGTTRGDEGTDTNGLGCAARVCEHDGNVYACGDCVDNDGDGAIDCADPECFGPCDDSEAEFGSPLEDKDPCKQDCYFDGNGGQGGGDCQWNLKCDPLEPGGPLCAYDPDLDPDDPDDLTDDYGKCVDGDPATCANGCTPPNGCDCFGCCTIDGVDRFIGSPGCSSDNLGACSPCTKQEALCGNACNDGEICFPEIEPSLCD